MSISSVAYHNDCPLENVLRHLNMHTEPLRTATQNPAVKEKKTKRNGNVFVYFWFSRWMSFAIHFHFHSIWFIFMELFLISLMEKLCKLLALFSSSLQLLLIAVSFLSLMLTNYKHTRMVCQHEAKSGSQMCKWNWEKKIKQSTWNWRVAQSIAFALLMSLVKAWHNRELITEELCCMCESNSVGRISWFSNDAISMNGESLIVWISWCY